MHENHIKILASLIAFRNNEIAAINRRRSWRPAEKAMACARYLEEIDTFKAAISLMLQADAPKMTHHEPNHKALPDFQTWQERDKYFTDHADYFTVVKKSGVGTYDRTEFKTLDEAEKAAQTRQTIGGAGWMIYAVIGEQSAFVKAIKSGV